MKTIKIIPIKKEVRTKGVRKATIKNVRWTCNIELTNDKGNTRTIEGINFMSQTKLKKEALELAQNEKKRILSKGKFYFNF